MNIPVSIGELVDKYSILEIKMKKIKNNAKLDFVRNEAELLSSLCQPIISKYPYLHQMLVHFNTIIWEQTDIVKEMHVTNNRYAEIAQDIFLTNDKRFRIKNIINNSEKSTIQEQKSYVGTSISVKIANEQELNDNIDKINRLMLEYDVITIQTCVPDSVKQIFCTSNFVIQNDN